MPEWRNWQTRRTQNPVGLTPRVGSTPTSGTGSQRGIQNVALQAAEAGHVFSSPLKKSI